MILQIDSSTIQQDETYDMTQPKGVALLIYNSWQNSPRVSKPSNPGKRGVPEANRKNDFGRTLESLLIQLGFYVIKRSNVSANTMRKNVSGLSDQYHGYSGSHNSLLLVAVANSNERGQILDADDRVVPVSEFLNHFSSSRCPALNGKPKIFLLLLRVTTRNPILSMVDEIKESALRKSTRLSTKSDMPVYFEPEPLNVGDDFLVTRIMYEDDLPLDGGPTFGGVSSTPVEGEVPWFAQAFVKALADQAGTTELTDILANLKRGYREHFASPRSDGTTRSLGKNSESSYTSVLLRGGQRDQHVNIFTDNGLRKKLFIMPGL